MKDGNCSEVRFFASREEYEGMVDYFHGASDAFLRGMGAERALLPPREVWVRNLLTDHELPDERKERLYVGWYNKDVLVGHSSVNRIKVGEEAFFHLHLWHPELRQAGLGSSLCRRSIALYFDRLKLQVLWCEPYAENPAPNRTLPSLGFEFIKRYRTIPGPINFEQDVNLYCLPRAKARALSGS